MKKTVIRGLLILFGGISCLFFIAPIILKGIINIGSVAGLLFFGGIFLIGAFYDGFVSLIKKLLKSKIGKTAFVCACAFLACALSTAAVSSVCMIRASANYPRENATLIVLGCKFPNALGLLCLNRIAAQSLTNYAFVQPMILIVMFISDFFTKKEEKKPVCSIIGGLLVISGIFGFQAV